MYVALNIILMRNDGLRMVSTQVLSVWRLARLQLTIAAAGMASASYNASRRSSSLLLTLLDQPFHVPPLPPKSAETVSALLAVADHSSNDPDTFTWAVARLASVIIQQLQHQQAVDWGTEGEAAVVWLMYKCINPMASTSALSSVLQMALNLLDDGLLGVIRVRHVASQLVAAGALDVLARIGTLRVEGDPTHIQQNVAVIACKLAHSATATAIPAIMALIHRYGRSCDLWPAQDLLLRVLRDVAEHLPSMHQAVLEPTFLPVLLEVLSRPCSSCSRALVLDVLLKAAVADPHARQAFKQLRIVQILQQVLADSSKAGNADLVDSLSKGLIQVLSVCPEAAIDSTAAQIGNIPVSSKPINRGHLAGYRPVMTPNDQMDIPPHPAAAAHACSVTGMSCDDVALEATSATKSKPTLIDTTSPQEQLVVPKLWPSPSPSKPSSLDCSLQAHRPQAPQLDTKLAPEVLQLCGQLKPVKVRSRVQAAGQMGPSLTSKHAADTTSVAPRSSTLPAYLAGQQPQSSSCNRQGPPPVMPDQGPAASKSSRQASVQTSGATSLIASATASEHAQASLSIVSASLSRVHHNNKGSNASAASVGHSFSMKAESTSCRQNKGNPVCASANESIALIFVAKQQQEQPEWYQQQEEIGNKIH